ncbi:hypothetical protein [Pedobacter sp.]
MARQLPTVDILGTIFCVDVLREELWQQEAPANRIPFAVFDQEGNGYTFLYDLERKGAPQDKSGIREMGDRYRWVTLPALMELDPEGIALKYNIPVEVLCPEKAGQFTNLQEDDEFYDDGLFG